MMAANSILYPAMVVWVLLMMLIPCGLLCILQYVLARMESPWPGRVLPILSGTFSVLVFLMLLFNISAMVGLNSAAMALLAAVLVLLVLNIPTALFIVVYRTTRRRQSKKKDMDKMNIQDLE